MAETTVEILVRPVPESLVDRIEDEARDLDITAQEAAVRVLSTRFSVARVESLRVYGQPLRRRTGLILSVPAKLRTKIRSEAARKNTTLRDVVCSTLAAHYGIDVDTTDRRRRGAQGDG